MHDAKLTSLSKIEVGQTILVTPEQEVAGVGHVAGRERTGKFRMFGRPKDPTCVPLRVADKSFEPDSWSGKVWTLTLDDGSKTEPRYGTTHVYVSNAPAKPKGKRKGSTIATDQGVIIAETRHVEPQVEVEVTRAGDWRRVTVAPDGTMRVADWKGGDYEGTTPHGKRVHITPDGVLTVIEDDGTERPGVLTSLDEQLDEANAGEPDVAVATAERCGQCKGFGVVRRYGANKNHAYKTLNGAEQATVKGNSVKCPTCKGATLLLDRAV
jgi:hypothetical protein